MIDDEFFFLFLKKVLSDASPLSFFKDLLIPLGFGYVILTYFVIVGTSNAVNLTDGLDGLAIGPVMTSALTFGFQGEVLNLLDVATVSRGRVDAPDHLLRQDGQEVFTLGVSGLESENIVELVMTESRISIGSLRG